MDSCLVHFVCLLLRLLPVVVQARARGGWRSNHPAEAQRERERGGKSRKSKREERGMLTRQLHRGTIVATHISDRSPSAAALRQTISAHTAEEREEERKTTTTTTEMWQESLATSKDTHEH